MEIVAALGLQKRALAAARRLDESPLQLLHFARSHGTRAIYTHTQTHGIEVAKRNDYTGSGSTVVYRVKRLWCSYAHAKKSALLAHINRTSTLNQATAATTAL